MAGGGRSGRPGTAVLSMIRGALATLDLHLVYLLNAPILLLALALIWLRWRPETPSGSGQPVGL